MTNLRQRLEEKRDVMIDPFALPKNPIRPLIIDWLQWSDWEDIGERADRMAQLTLTYISELENEIKRLKKKHESNLLGRI